MRDPGSRERVRLYQPAFHVGMRVAHGFIATLVFAGIAGTLVESSVAADWRSLGLVVLLPILAWSTVTVFRTRAIHGSSRGLELPIRGTWRTIPWSEVGPADYTWWSFNRFGRVASLRVQDERAPILFFANDGLLAALRELAQLH
jgi:hypothetical protein